MAYEKKYLSQSVFSLVLLLRPLDVYFSAQLPAVRRLQRPSRYQNRILIFVARNFCRKKKCKSAAPIYLNDFFYL